MKLKKKIKKTTRVKIPNTWSELWKGDKLIENKMKKTMKFNSQPTQVRGWNWKKTNLKRRQNKNLSLFELACQTNDPNRETYITTSQENQEKSQNSISK
jgi:CRISPR/Cas system-associated exonuclease Cas4 (RecB family)